MRIRGNCITINTPAAQNKTTFVAYISPPKNKNLRLRVYYACSVIVSILLQGQGGGESSLSGLVNNIYFILSIFLEEEEFFFFLYDQ
jgi:hypothetical protein